MTATLLQVRELSVHAGAAALLQPLSLVLAAGDCCVVAGESGAGKSLLLQAVMGALPAGLRARGEVVVDGWPNAAGDTARRRRVWGRRIALLPQEPWSALDPTMHVAGQLAEVHALVREPAARWPAAHAAASAALAALGLAGAGRLYPWQLSGGMAQRVAFAVALAGGAQLLLVDEPTKGLDSALRGRVLQQLRQVQRDGGAVLVVTHDLALAADLGGRILVLRDGRLVDSGDTAAVLARPQHAYTRALVVASDPARWAPAPAVAPGAAVVRAGGLVKAYAGRRVVDAASLTLRRGERVAVVGPSGGGKTTFGNLLVGAVAPDAGQVVRGADVPLHALQKLYQDPGAAFAPHVALRRSLQDVCTLRRLPWSAVQTRLAALQLPEPLLARRPAQVSGGELQRLALLRVLLVRPALVFADEPTSRLDPLTQQQTVAVLLQAQAETGFALLFVTHDAGLARFVAGPAATLRWDAGTGFGADRSG